MLNPLCKYKDILGKPGQGFHKARLVIGKYSFAANDTLATVALAAMVSLSTDVNFFLAFAGLLLLSILLHALFCVKTTTNSILGLP
jgi:hypothetical protein